jgi:putative restriction endonuclease
VGNLASPESLLHRWEEMQHDPSLQDLPYKIELNSWGKIEMTPASVRRGILQAALAAQIRTQLSDGVAFISCPVLTAKGICVPAVAWASASFMARQSDTAVFRRAPEICAEIAEPDIEQKTAAYLAAGAKEVWSVSEEGRVRYFGREGERTASEFSVSVTLPLPLIGIKP